MVNALVCVNYETFLSNLFLGNTVTQSFITIRERISRIFFNLEIEIKKRVKIIFYIRHAFFCVTCVTLLPFPLTCTITNV